MNIKEPTEIEKELLCANYNYSKNRIHFISDTSKYYIHSVNNLHSSNLWAIICPDYKDILLIIANTYTNDIGIKFIKNMGTYFGSTVSNLHKEGCSQGTLGVLLEEYTNISKLLDKLDLLKSIA